MPEKERDIPEKDMPPGQDPTDTSEFTPESDAQQDSYEMTPEKSGDEKESVVTLSVAEYEQLRRAAQEREEYFQRLQRAVADFQNLQKRTKREIDSFRKYAIQDFAKAILPAIDNMERAIAAGADAKQADGVLEGVRLVLEQLKSAFQYFGLTQIESVGLQFNPDCHEAVMQEETADVAPLTVVKELEKGYKLHDRVIRPSKVVVAVLPRSKKQEPKNKSNDAAEQLEEQPPVD